MSSQIPATKDAILAALRKVYPPPQDLIDEVKTVEDALIDALYTTWMGRTELQWKDKRPEDGVDIYNALRSKQGKHCDSMIMRTNNIVDLMEIDLPPFSASNYELEKTEVWYLLVNADGSPFEGTGPDKVELSASTDIANFRDAVKKKNTRKLAMVDASDLKVYLNKDELGGDQLGASKALNSIGDAGKTEGNALLVVVPHIEPSILPAIKIAFNHICRY
jgi:hypothetical protein